MSSHGEAAVSAGDLVAARFTVVDYVVFVFMLLASVGIGVFSAIKNRGRESTHNFLLGGREMSPYPVAISLLGGIFSAISILGNPTEVYYFGAQVVTSLVGIFPAIIVVHQVILPIFYNLRLVSVNEYIELRYNTTTLRKLATVCHLITKLFYMGICLYAPSLALSTVTGLSTWASMLTMGFICTFYITIGGVKAVVYTDVLQTLLMFFGVLVVVVVCCFNAGLDNLWTTSLQDGRLHVLDMNTSPYVRHTFWSTSVLGFYITVSILGLNQGCYQRFASLGSLQMAKRLAIFFVVGMFVLWGLFYFSGVVAYGIYHDCDPLISGRIEKPDQILPYLVMDKLAYIKGLPGLFVAAVYGGMLSSLSTCGNSIACLIWQDFLHPLPYFARLSSTASTTICKLLSAFAGLSGIFLGMLAGKLGNVFYVSKSISGAIMGPLVGIFVAGIFTPWANTKSVVGGFLTALIYNIWIVVGKFRYGRGSPKRLPLSTEGCPENLLLQLANATLTTTSLPDVLLDSDVFPEDAHNTTLYGGEMIDATEEEKTLYDVSYCYSGITGVIITVAVGSLMSLCTGPLRPGTVDASLVSPCCARFHEWLWNAFGGTSKQAGDSLEEKERGIALLSNSTATPS
ncbi:hypothetical protein O3P69_018334 [Scylla paramamosain]|uniref:Sodium-coupled monocarboxylate transporter 1 n=1 Tax=Scylla paramamosain TaxID=85552 RepID=A0AAW0TK66_SCYPA